MRCIRRFGGTRPRTRRGDGAVASHADALACLLDCFRVNCDVCSFPALARSLRVTKNCFLTCRSGGVVAPPHSTGCQLELSGGNNAIPGTVQVFFCFFIISSERFGALLLDGLTIENDERDETRDSGRRSVVCRRAPLQLHWDPGEWTRSGARAHRKGARLNQPVGRRADARSAEASQLMG